MYAIIFYVRHVNRRLALCHVYYYYFSFVFFCLQLRCTVEVNIGDIIICLNIYFRMCRRTFVSRCKYILLYETCGTQLPEIYHKFKGKDSYRNFQIISSKFFDNLKKNGPPGIFTQNQQENMYVSIHSFIFLFLSSVCINIRSLLITSS